MKQEQFICIRVKLMEQLRQGAEWSDEEILERIDLLVSETARENRLTVKQREEIRRELFYSVRKLDILQELLDDDRVTEIMVCPWSDFRKLERPGLQEMLQKMEELKEENCRSSELAERVLDYLYYSFRSEGQYDSNEVYQMKCDCHREIVRCTAMVARMEKLHEKPSGKMSRSLHSAGRS